MAGVVASLVVVVAAGVAVATHVHHGPPTAGPADSTGFSGPPDNPAPASPVPAQVEGASWRGHGELAFTSSGQLDLLSNDGTVVTVPGPGMASQPQWSADGAWVAYLRTPAPPAKEPSDLEPSTLWVTAAAGTDTHPLSAGTSDVTGFAWAPSGDTLAFEAVGAGPAASSAVTVVLATPAGARTTPLVSAAYIGFFAWAPSGQSLALDAVHGFPGGQYRTVDQLEIVPIDGGAPRVVYSQAPTAAVVATWWPQASGLLFWVDPGGSGSAAADGMQLESIDLSSGTVRPLATTLPYRNWLAWSPDGTTLALVAGTDRVVWGPSRRVEWCRIPAGTCTEVASVTGTMSLEPAWTASGALLFVRAPSANPDTSRLPWSSVAGEPYGPASIAAWLDDQTIWTVSPGGGSARLLTGGGAHSPVTAGEGEVFSRHGQLCWLDPSTGATATIAGPIGTAGIDGTSYYGYIDWSRTFAWHR